MKRGTNQYQKKYKYPLGCHGRTWVSVLIILLVTWFLLASLPKNTIISPCPPEGCSLNPAHAAEIEKNIALERENSYLKERMKEYTDPTTANIVREIVRVFSPYGKKVVNEALDISFCESGWRADAYNFNTNGSHDFSVFQVNSIHTSRYGQGFYHNWVENVRVAEQIYKSQGWGPWVCAHKLGIE